MLSSAKTTTFLFVSAHLMKSEQCRIERNARSSFDQIITSHSWLRSRIHGPRSGRSSGGTDADTPRSSKAPTTG
ncbi:Uncharacterised protein [Mycobacteroides abscessus subsp. abscessus]|nr:Uncharacterised protein [Mycobacteroides abscessus subsp. abscessus]